MIDVPSMGVDNDDITTRIVAFCSEAEGRNEDIFQCDDRLGVDCFVVGPVQKCLSLAGVICCFFNVINSRTVQDPTIWFVGWRPFHLSDEDPVQTGLQVMGIWSRRHQEHAWSVNAGNRIKEDQVIYLD